MSDLYLTDEERHALCDSVIDGVSMVDVQIATDLINGYLGRSYTLHKYKERVKINRDNRGRLSHAPIANVTKVTAVYMTPFGKSENVLAEWTEENEDAYDGNPTEEYIDLDPERDGYFTFIGDLGLNAMIYQSRPKYLLIEYESGYKEIPSRLKSATAMLACNIRQAQSFAGARQLTSLDFQIRMTDDSFFTSDIKRMLKGLDSDESIF